MKRVAVIMGSASDLPLAKDALQVLSEFGVPSSARVLSAHRTPNETVDFVKSVEADGYGVLIAIAGKAAHLAGVLASHTRLPVIGVPAGSHDLGGLDALLSTVQMPKGVPVATVAIGGAANAALLAVRILALEDGDLADQLVRYAQTLAKKSIEADESLQKEIETI
jgi:5-(carboxyamino)imidazole ribonucleotide mutase